MKKHLIILTWLAMFAQMPDLVGQEDNFSYFRSIIPKYKGAVLKQKVDSLLEASREQQDLRSVEAISFVYSSVLARGGDNLGAIHYLKISLELIEKYGPGTINHVRGRYNLGRYYLNNQQYDDALIHFDKVIEIDSFPTWSAKAHAEAGRCHNLLGDYFKSLDYFQRAFDLFYELEQYSSIVVQTINLAWTYEKINTPESLANREKVLLRADSLFRVLDLKVDQDVTFENVINLKNSIGNQYTLDDYYDFEKARKVYLTNLEGGLARQDTNAVAMTYNNLANLYNLEKRDSARYFISRGLEIVLNPNDHARLYDNLSDYYLNQNQYSQAVENIHKAIETSLGSQMPVEAPPTAIQLNDSNAKDYLMYCLHRKSEILHKLYTQTSDTQYLKILVAHGEAGDLLSSMISGSSYNPESKLFWRKEASSLYLTVVEAATLLGELETAFYFMEKNKAMLLAEEIADNTLASELPLQMAERERTLKGQVLNLEAKNDDRKGLIEARRAYETFTDSVKAFYPEYVKKRFEIEIQGLDQARQSLASDEVLISYIWNKPKLLDEKIIGLAIGKKHTQAFDIMVDDGWYQLIDEYQQLISRPLQTEKDLADFSRVSHSLYQKLIPQEAFAAGKLPGKLTIVPDGPLQNLPFEALIADQQTDQFLLELTDVQYLYSHSFLRYSQNLRREKAQGKILAYAPVEFENQLPALPYSKVEAEAVARALEGEAKLEREASKASFLSNSQDYQVLHLATHANAGRDHWIAFSDEQLELHELYTYQSNAELVVLSGCKTLLGEIALGEGVLSLARGFFYSGAKSVVASVWNTNDKATSEIMESFYDNLRNGENKPEALNNAKRAYLANHELSERSPYYWASPLLIGDPEELNPSQLGYQYWAVPILLLVLLLIYRARQGKREAAEA